MMLTVTDDDGLEATHAYRIRVVSGQAKQR